MQRGRIFAPMAVVLAGLALAPSASAGSGNVAALQVALKAIGLYPGSVDGVKGPGTARAVRLFQRRRGLPVDGVAGPRTRRALGRRGGPSLGSRAMSRGDRGWDVAAVQFLLSRRGLGVSSVDGGFGPTTRAAARRFQRAAGLFPDGVVGPATLRALRGRARGGRAQGRRPMAGGVGGPVLFFRPVRAPLGDGFGTRWGRPHQGIDFTAPAGARVAAAGRGVVRFAGWNTGGYGYLVVVGHRLGFETWYAHLSRVTAYNGEPVAGGTRLGLVGSTGHATGPHLHFEVRLNGTPIDPMPRLLATAASASARAALSMDGRPHSGCDRAGLRARSRRGGGRPPLGVC